MNTSFVRQFVVLLGSLSPLAAQINVSSDGSDGAFVPAANTVVDLSLAATGTWNQSSPSPGNGIYDSGKRAIVFKYTSVHIASGRTVTFKNHPSRAAVVWLVSGDVIVSGTLSLDGGWTSNATLYGEPGPGGFRGGSGSGSAAGFGIGGASGGAGLSGAHSSVYGRPGLNPLTGGSGGSGSPGWAGTNSGGGGGGAILIAAAGSITVGGAINANTSGGNGSGAGSSGSIRLICDSLSGNGSLSAFRDGRIRLEANSVSGSMLTSPQVIAVAPTNPATLWPPENSAKVAILSVDAAPVPEFPTAPLELDADVEISAAVSQASVVTVQTRNFPPAGTVKVRAAGKNASAAVVATATFQGGDYNEATWTASITFAEGHTVLQAIATAD